MFDNYEEFKKDVLAMPANGDVDPKLHKVIKEL